MTGSRDYDAELACLLKIVHDQGGGFPTSVTPPFEVVDICAPILTWIVESSRNPGMERENANP